MPIDDGDDDAPDLGAPLPQDDRLWRHPSEVGGMLAAAAAAKPAPAPAGPRIWGIALVSGLVGAVLAVGVLSATVGIGGSDGDNEAYPTTTVAVALDEPATDDVATAGAWLGVEGTDVDREVALTLPAASGATVTRVADRSPALAAGLQPGDIITAIAGQHVTSMAALVATMRQHQAGELVDVEYWRDGAEHHCSATLASRG